MASKRRSAAVAVRRLDADFMRTVNAKDAGGLVAAFYAQNAVMMPPDQPIVKGRKQIQTFFQGLIDHGLSRLQIKTTNIEGAGEFAYGRGTYTLEITPPDGPPVHDSGKYVVVYRRQRDRSWRAIVDIYNSDQATK
jgi:uncharacterized protein (TIGR02246 family)